MAKNDMDPNARWITSSSKTIEDQNNKAIGDIFFKFLFRGNNKQGYTIVFNNFAYNCTISFENIFLY